MIYGYSRISTKSKEGKQSHRRQIKELKQYGVDELLFEEISGGKSHNDRPVLDGLLRSLEPGDQIVVLELSRISRSLEDLLQIIKTIKEKKVSFVSIKEGVKMDGNENDMFGDFLIHILGAVAEFERSLIRSRVVEGVRIAKEAGKYKGRKEVLTDRNEKVKAIPKLLKAGYSKQQVAETLQISRKTIYRKMKQYPELFEDVN